MLGAFAALLTARLLQNVGVSTGWLLVPAMFLVASVFCGGSARLPNDWHIVRSGAHRC